MDDFNRSANFGQDFGDLSMSDASMLTLTSKQPEDLSKLPTDPESLALALADEPAIFAWWQAQAEEYRYQLERLKNQRDLCKATAYLNAKGAVEERKATSAADPDATLIIQEIEQTEHRYRYALNEMTASDVRMTAIKKLLSWRIEELKTISVGELPVSSRRIIPGNNIDFSRRGNRD